MFKSSVLRVQKNAPCLPCAITLHDVNFCVSWSNMWVPFVSLQFQKVRWILDGLLHRMP